MQEGVPLGAKPVYYGNTFDVFAVAVARAVLLEGGQFGADVRIPREAFDAGDELVEVGLGGVEEG